MNARTLFPTRRLARTLARTLAAVAFAVLPLAAAAQPLACPAPATLVQAAPCPTAEQLRVSYIGYCSDNRRMYAQDPDTCASEEAYQRVKNVARWESADGAFEGYLSCQPSAVGVASLPAATMSIARAGTVTRVVCQYGDAATLVHRTKARCRLQDAAACAADPGACRARCD